MEAEARPPVLPSIGGSGDVDFDAAPVLAIDSPPVPAVRGAAPVLEVSSPVDPFTVPQVCSSPGPTPLTSVGLQIEGLHREAHDPRPDSAPGPSSRSAGELGVARSGVKLVIKWKASHVRCERASSGADAEAGRSGDLSTGVPTGVRRNVCSDADFEKEALLVRPPSKSWRQEGEGRKESK